MASTRRITVKVHGAIWDKFVKQTEALFLKREAFLNSVIRSELPFLAEEMAGKQLSQEAKRYISRKFNELQPIPVNIMLDEDVAVALDQVVSETNLVRDGFINRLLVWLRSEDELLRYFRIPLTLDDREEANEMPTSPLKAMEAVRKEPFTYIREELKKGEQGLYAVSFPDVWVGFSCYLADEDVPGTAAYKEREQAISELCGEPEAAVFERSKAEVGHE